MTLRSPLAWSLVAVALAVSATLITVRWLSPPPELATWSVLPGSGVEYEPEFGAPVLSPDGQTIAFVGRTVEGERKLWLQPVGGRGAEPLPGTEEARDPFWSPDGRSLAFFTGQLLRRIDLASGEIRDLAPIESARGGAWGEGGEAGTILFAPSPSGPIFRIPASGGTPTGATELDEERGDVGHRLPVFVPGSETFLFHTLPKGSPGVEESLAVYAGSLDSKEVREVLTTESSVLVADSGHLLFLREGDLVGQPFDLDVLELSGEAVPVAEDVGVNFSFVTVASLSRTGLLLYQERIGAEVSRLTWLDRQGGAIGTVGEAADYGTVALSNDERRIVTTITDPVTSRNDLWVVDIERGTSARMTFESGDDLFPVWSADDEKLYYYSERVDGYGIYAMPVVAGAKSERITPGDEFQLLWSVSPDGRTGWLVTNHFPQGTRWDVETIDLETGAIETFLDGPHRESGPAISPDGRWLAYHSDASGELQVHVVASSGEGESLQVSVDGGSHAEWSRGGRELVYRASNGALTAVEIETVDGLSSSPPVRLFHPGERDLVGNRYSVTSDGERFLVNQPSEAPGIEPWVLVENWTRTLD